jgi:arylsulfatase A
MKLNTPNMKKTKQPTSKVNLNKLSSNQQRLVLNKPIIEGPRQVGFDTFHGLSASLDMAPYLYIDNSTFLGHEDIHMKPREVPGRPGMASRTFSAINVSDTLVNKAKDLLSTHIHPDSPPLFLFLSLTSPHTPIVPSPAFQGRSSLGPYGDYVMQTDDVVGQVVASLTQLNALENTLLIFTSDNGFSNGALSNPLNKFRHPHSPSGIFRGIKADIYEGGHRIPFVVHWPARIQPNTINKTPISLVNLFATFLDITHQAVVPQKDYGEDSDTSLLPLFVEKHSSSSSSAQESSPIIPKQFIVHSMKGCFAIRGGKHLLALCSGSGGWLEIEMYNLMMLL